MKIINNEVNTLPFIVGAGGVTAGCMVVISAGKVVKAAAAPTAATVVGIACDDADADAIVDVEIIGTGTVVMAPFINSGTKKTFADTDLGKVYDLSDSTKVNPDDVTGGIAMLVGYDNDTLEVRFAVPAAARYL